MNPNNAAVGFVECMWDESTGFSAVDVHTVQEVVLAPAKMFCCLFETKRVCACVSDLTAAPVTNVLTVICELVKQHSDQWLTNEPVLTDVEANLKNVALYLQGKLKSFADMESVMSGICHSDTTVNVLC